MTNAEASRRPRALIRWVLTVAAAALAATALAEFWRLVGAGTFLAVHSTLIAGSLAIFCAICVGAQEILLGPSSPNYPPGPWWVRLFLFLWMATMAVRGTDMLSSLGTPHPQVLPWSGLVSWAACAAAQLAVLFMIARTRRPSWFYSRVERAAAKARQGESDAAVAVLEMEAAAVARPHELPGQAADVLPENDRRLAQHYAAHVTD